MSALLRKDLHVHIDGQALRGNVRALRSLCRPGVKFCAVVKANGYGHGIRNMVEILKPEVDYFAVASMYEAMEIADQISRQKLLVLEPVYAGADAELIRYGAEKGIECTVSSLSGLHCIEEVLSGTSKCLGIHVNVQTGMGRCGVSGEEAKRMVKALEQNRQIRAAGVYTHFATADACDLSYAREQLENFQQFLTNIPSSLRNSMLVHAANSPATIQLPEAHFDMVRCGISIYGYSTIEGPLPIQLKAALKLDAPIVHLLRIGKGETVSYGRLFQAQRDTLAAVIPVGYSDGIRRDLSGKMILMLNGRPVSQIGRITMNQIVLDVTDVPGASCGQRVTVIDSDPASPCGVNAWAEAENTINYEILTRVPSYVRYVMD